MDGKVLSVRLKGHELLRLQELAVAYHRSPSTVVREMIGRAKGPQQKRRKTNEGSEEVAQHSAN